MQVSVKRHGTCFSFPARYVGVKRFEKPFILGIDFIHCFHLHFFRNAGHAFDRAKVKENISIFVENLKSLNIIPVFVAPGLYGSLPSFANAYFGLETRCIFEELGVLCIRAPSDPLSQLAAMFRHKAVNAIMSSCEVCLSDVKQWIHYIDFDAQKAVVLSVDQKQLIELISNPTFSQRLCAPFVVDHKLCWLFRPPLFGKTPTPISLELLNLIIKNDLPIPNCVKRGIFPQKCVSYFESLSGVMIVIFRTLARIPLSRIPITPLADEFLPLMLQQNPSPHMIPVDSSLIFQVLSLQNMVSRPFTTLFEALKNVSSTSENKGARDANYIITEATRRFLTALDYVAPGGGLSAWGRAVLVANSGIDEASVMFIELIRGDCLDAEIDSSSAVGVGVMEIIERTFNFFQCESSKYLQMSSSFATVVNALQTGLWNLLRLVSITVFLEYGSTDPLEDVLTRLPFRPPKSNGAGALMRFMFEASEDKLKEFIKGVDNRDQLRLDVKKALSWWSNMSRATQELKQRSLKPNSRVSNLKTILVLFECADELVRKRSASFLCLL